MSTQPDTPELELTPEQQEVWTRFQDMLVSFPKEFKRMKDACQFSLADTKGPLAFITEKLGEVQAAQQALEKQKGHADYEYAATQLRIAERMFGAAKRMMEIQGEYDRKNLALAEQGLELAANAGEDPHVWIKLDQAGMLAPYKFTSPLENVEFLEARAQANHYFGLQHWMNSLDGIDAILRATTGQKAIVCQTRFEEAGRAKLAEIFKQAMAEDQQLTVQMGKWGTELQETMAYFDWASNALKGLQGKPADARRAVLADPEWQKLNGRVVVLATLTERVQAFPAIAEYFPKPERPELPYEQLEWRDPLEPRVGTGRLQGTGQLRQAGTGRLQGGTGRLK